MDAEKKKPGFDKRITIEILLEMRRKFKELPSEMSHEARGQALVPDYPQFSARTLMDYSRIALGVCQEVLDRVIAGEISITALAEFACGWDDDTQKYLAKEFVDQKLTVSDVRQIKQLKREHGTMGYAEAIARVKGEIPADQPRRENKRTLDQILTQIADMGSRWRALVSMSLEMIREEEAAAGVHEVIFEKVFILRQLVGEQYDFVNSKVQRYMNLFRKKLKETAKGAEPKDLLPIDEGLKTVDVDFVERPGKDAGDSPAEEK